MIGEWIAVGMLVLAGLFLLQIEHHARKYKVAIVVILGAILYFSIIGMFSSGEVDLTSPRGIINGVYLYVGWIGQTTANLWEIGTDAVTMVGNAIKINNTGQERPRR